MDSGNTFPGRQVKNRVSWVGLGIGTSVSLVAYFGISWLLYFIENVEMPEEQLVIFTSLFYGLIFFVALGGLRMETRRHKMLISRRPFEEPSDPLSRNTKGKIANLKSAAWIVFSVLSLGWITPALVIYWTAPKHATGAVVGCACVLSMAAGITYTLKKSGEIKTPYHHVMFFIGIAVGAFLANRVGVWVWS